MELDQAHTSSRPSRTAIAMQFRAFSQEESYHLWADGASGLPENPTRPRHRWSSGPAEDLAKILTLENALPPRRYCNQKGACASFQPISAKPRPHRRAASTVADRHHLGTVLQS